MIPIVICALGTVHKNVKEKQEKFEIRGRKIGSNVYLLIHTHLRLSLSLSLSLHKYIHIYIYKNMFLYLLYYMSYIKVGRVSIPASSCDTKKQSVCGRIYIYIYIYIISRKKQYPLFKYSW